MSKFVQNFFVWVSLIFCKSMWFQAFFEQFCMQLKLLLSASQQKKIQFLEQTQKLGFSSPIIRCYLTCIYGWQKQGS